MGIVRSSLALALAAVNCLAALPAGAGGVPADEVFNRACAWLDARAPTQSRRLSAAVARPANRRGNGVRFRGRPTGEVRTVTAGGGSVAHFIPMDGGGYLALSADSLSPIGFSASDEVPSLEENSPLSALIGLKPGMGDVKISSERVLSSAASPADSADLIDDMRVMPLVKSKWQQQEVGDKPVYNYYVTNGWCCGCVATAMAQLMRFNRHPSSAVSPRTFTCYIGNSQKAKSLTMKGGTYDWDGMPLVPDSGITDAQCEMIGRICYDAGVSMHMHYGFNGQESGAFPGFEFAPLVSVFGYANARSYVIDEGTVPNDVIAGAILANLDAGYPVLLGIFGTSYDGDPAVHSIIADGYGFIDGELYCHLNMGWSGQYDYWYRIPEIDVSGYFLFTDINTVVYNIFPEKTGELVTGRVLYPDGTAAAGAEVEAEMVYSRLVSKSPEKYETVTNLTGAVADMNGIFAVFAPTGTESTVTLSASIGDWTTTNSVTVALSSNAPSPSSLNYHTGDFDYVDSGPQVGNSWGNDLFLVARPRMVSFASGADAETGANGFRMVFEGTEDASYMIEWREALERGDWTEFRRLAVPEGGLAEVFLPVDPAYSSGFYRIRPVK